MRIRAGGVTVTRREFECELHVLLGGEGRDQIEELEDEADLLATEERELPAPRGR